MEKFRLKILTPEGTVIDKEAAGASSKNSKEDDYNDLECSIGEGMLRVSTKEVLLLVKSFEQRNL